MSQVYNTYIQSIFFSILFKKLKLSNEYIHGEVKKKKLKNKYII